VARDDVPELGDTGEHFSASARARFGRSRQAEAALQEAQDAKRAAQARIDRLIAETDATDRWFRLAGEGPPTEGPWS
jgi:hypothetical protein